ncbi:MAG: NAD(+) diphosphatase [Clostridiales bacterium]|nr:NAD(+) diphosphatase [Clostridiales bacterium]
MFQDIHPHLYHVEFSDKKPSGADYVCILRKDMLLLEERDGGISLPRFDTVRSVLSVVCEDLTYLFSVDGISFFLSLRTADEAGGFGYHPIFAFRELKPEWLGFAGATAFQLALWYSSRRYCGRCASLTTHKTDERAVVCPKCGLIEYPKIAPVVIVGIVDGDRILLTKYAAGYNRYALVAGFVEIGETLEDAVRREVMEEVGLQVKNIRYYKSQPWAFSGSLLSGFFADLDGDDTIRVDEKELAEGKWFHRNDIPTDGNTMSLTWTMVEAFRSGEVF